MAIINWTFLNKLHAHKIFPLWSLCILCHIIIHSNELCVDKSGFGTRLNIISGRYQHKNWTHNDLTWLSSDGKDLWCLSSTYRDFPFLFYNYHFLSVRATVISIQRLTTMVVGNFCLVLEIVPNWNLLPIGSLHNYFLKTKILSHLCWDLNPNLWLMRLKLYHKSTLASETE